MSTSYTLKSNRSVYAPGIVAWAINGAKFKKDQKRMVSIIAEAWKIPEKAAAALVLGAVPYTINEQEGVEFTVPRGSC